jgi:hypothetical protein
VILSVSISKCGLRHQIESLKVLAPTSIHGNGYLESMQSGHENLVVLATMIDVDVLSPISWKESTKTVSEQTAKSAADRTPLENTCDREIESKTIYRGERLDARGTRREMDEQHWLTDNNKDDLQRKIDMNQRMSRRCRVESQISVHDP